MIYKEIPADSVEIQAGLYAQLRTVTVGGTTYIGYNLFSAEGYCFYWLSHPENYDEEGNLKPENERSYATFMASAYKSIEEINKDVISVDASKSISTSEQMI